MSTEIESIVHAALAMRLLLPNGNSFEIIQSDGIDESSIMRIGAGHYQMQLTAPIATGALHIARNGIDNTKGTDLLNAPAHAFCVMSTGPNGESIADIYVYAVGVPPVAFEDDAVVQFVWHASPEVPALEVTP